MRRSLLTAASPKRIIAGNPDLTVGNSGYNGPGDFHILMKNPATAAGLITRAHVQASQTSGSVKFFSAFASGGSFQTRAASEFVGTSFVNEIQYFNLATPFAVQAGDFLGIYLANPNVIWNNDGAGVTATGARGGMGDVTAPGTVFPATYDIYMPTFVLAGYA